MSERVPAVSVVIPTYNCVRYLPEAVDSVLAQTYRDLEIIVVDDGSTDNTPEVLARYGDQIRVIRQANQGSAAARNAGILAARGEYIAFLDADDLWLEQKLERQMALFHARPEIGWGYSDYRELTTSGLRAETFLEQKALKPPPEGWILLRSLSGYITWTGTVIVRRECFETAGLFCVSLRRGQDHDMWIRLACRFRAACADEVLALYRQHDGQVFSRPRPGVAGWYMWRVYSRFMREEYRRLGPDLRREAGPIARQALVFSAHQVGMAAMAHRRWSTAIRWYARALCTMLGDEVSQRSLLPWYLGQMLDSFVPSAIMRAARRVKRVLLPHLSTPDGGDVSATAAATPEVLLDD